MWQLERKGWRFEGLQIVRHAGRHNSFAGPFLVALYRQLCTARYAAQSLRGCAAVKSRETCQAQGDLDFELGSTQSKGSPLNYHD
jgi:hypothetical protein